ncbi:hypothetical protein [Croceicoccus mobilis]|uniref:hypothetical protein n=1 Tax=Croceicoccus mobilis TaxID=1703339 RepID=UPI0012E748D4|nr:hypothetical protein [Croceicoccus mobilis]
MADSDPFKVTAAALPWLRQLSGLFGWLADDWNGVGSGHCEMIDPKASFANDALPKRTAIFGLGPCDLLYVSDLVAASCKNLRRCRIDRGDSALAEPWSLDDGRLSVSRLRVVTFSQQERLFGNLHPMA